MRPILLAAAKRLNQLKSSRGIVGCERPTQLCFLDGMTDRNQKWTTIWRGTSFEARIGRIIGHLDEAAMVAVNRAMAAVFGLA